MADAFTGSKLDEVVKWLREQFPSGSTPNKQQLRDKLESYAGGKTSLPPISEEPLLPDAFDNLRDRLVQSANDGAWRLVSPGFDGTIRQPLTSKEKDEVKRCIGELPIAPGKGGNGPRGGARNRKRPRGDED